MFNKFQLMYGIRHFRIEKMAYHAALEHNYGQQLAKPLHFQQIEEALQLEPFLNYVENIVNDPGLKRCKTSFESLKNLF